MSLSAEVPSDAAISTLPEACAEEEYILGSLSHHLKKVADLRGARGKVHKLHAALCLVVVGLLCSQLGISRLVAFAQSQGARRRFNGPKSFDKRDAERALIPATPSAWLVDIGLVWRGQAHVPSLQTLLRLLANVKASDLEGALGDWFVEVIQLATKRRLAVSVDGKTMRGCEGTHVLSAFAHDVFITVGHCQVDVKNNELSCLREWLAELIERFPALWLLRADGLFADRTLCQLLKDNGREWMFAIKENQPNLLEKLEILFSPILCAGSPKVIDEPEKRGPMWNCESTTPSSWTNKNPPCVCPA